MKEQAKANRKMIKVLKVLHNAGIKPGELRWLIYADMDQMLYELQKRKLTLQTLIDTIKEPASIEELMTRVDAVAFKFDAEQKPKDE